MSAGEVLSGVLGWTSTMSVLVLHVAILTLRLMATAQRLVCIFVSTSDAELPAAQVCLRRAGLLFPRPF